jgi:Acetyltransferase (GNAT) domain
VPAPRTPGVSSGVVPDKHKHVRAGAIVRCAQLVKIVAFDPDAYHGVMSAKEVPRLTLRSERVTLRTPQFQDAERCYKWFADPEITRYLPLAGKGELPMDAIREFIERVRGSDRPELAVSIEVEGEYVGCGGLRSIDRESAEFCIVIGERHILCRPSTATISAKEIIKPPGQFFLARFQRPSKKAARDNKTAIQAVQSLVIISNSIAKPLSPVSPESFDAG